MLDSIYAFLLTDSLFWFFALVGTLIFLIRLLLVFFGFGFGGDLEHGGDMDAASDMAFQVFSLHSLSGFFMVFGWVGLAALQQFELSLGLSTLIAFAAGLVMLYIIRGLFLASRHLINTGDRFAVAQTVGKQGTVYQRISANGRGKIQVSVNQISREVDAVSEDASEIASFTCIEVVSVAGNDLVVVKPVFKKQ